MSDKNSTEQAQTEELQSETVSKEPGADAGAISESQDESIGPESELAGVQDKYLRLAAEFENFKKRTARERAKLINSANDELIMQLLDVVDNFERALGQTEQSVTQGKGDRQKLFQSLSDGARMIHGQLKKMLASHGVEEIQAKGALFDPELHEAALHIETGDTKPDHVAEVICKGYTRGKRVLRHAKVGVAKAKEKHGQEK